MNTSIPSLVVGDVIRAHNFIAEVVETKQDAYLQRSVVYLKYISGDRFSFNFLSSTKKPEFACMAGNHLATVWLEKANFTAE